MSSPAVGAGPLPLVEAKLAPAPVRPAHLVRPRLLEEIDRLAPAALTLLDAPVGFGKTVLVQSWCARTDVAVAWVSLDRSDDDPARLWTYLATGVDRIRPGLGRLALNRLRAPGVPTEAAVDELLNGIAAFGAPVAIVLDDLHVLGAECLGSIEQLLEHLPPNARVIATTRSDPAIGLGRLRGRGRLGEIRSRELALTEAEAAELLVRREGIALDDDDIRLLVDRTEGWPAGLYLAALWLRTTDDPKAGVSEFHGSHRHVADYLTEEVLDALDERTRDFLVRTSVLERFTAPLCDAVLGTTGSAETIDALVHSNLFLVPLDARGEWYRYHHLFGELLQLELAALDSSGAAEAHRRAHAWCREHGFVDEAFVHADAAGDLDALATLLADESAAMIRSGRHATYLRWAARLPDERFVEHPLVPVVGVLAARLGGRPKRERQRFVALATTARRERPEAWTAEHEVGLEIADIGWIETDVSSARDRAVRAVELARADVSVGVVAFAGAALVSLVAGDLEDAEAFALEAVGRPEGGARPHGLAIALAVLAVVEAERGKGPEALARGREAIRHAKEAAIDETATGGISRVALAVALERSGRTREAEREAIEGERLRREPEPELVHAYALLVLAGIRARNGHLDPAAEELSRAREIMRAFADTGRLPVLAESVEDALARARDSAVDVVEPPSAAELSVLQLLATDLSQREIGSTLYLSLNTVKTHSRVLYRKLGVTSRQAAVARATALGLIGEDDSPG